MRCRFTLDDGHEVLADCADDAPELPGMLHVRVKREHLPEDIQATWERGSPGYQGIEGYFSKDRIRIEDTDLFFASRYQRFIIFSSIDC